MLSMWNTVSGVTALAHMLEIGMLLAAGCCLYHIIMLRRSDRNMVALRNDSMDISSKRIKNIESAASGIRKELLDVEQERDILIEKLKVKEEELKTIHSAFDEMMKRSAGVRHPSATDDAEYDGSTLKADQANEHDKQMAGKNNALLTREQRDQLIALLDPGPKGDVDILSILGDDISHRLAVELESIFRADGWTTKDVAQSAFSKLPEGIILSVHSKETAPSYASFIQRTMATIGFPITATVNSKYREWSLTLIVGKMQ
jgi:hypothetical protein